MVLCRFLCVFLGCLQTRLDAQKRHFQYLKDDWDHEKDAIREMLGAGPALQMLDEPPAPPASGGFQEPALKGVRCVALSILQRLPALGAVRPG